MPRFLSQGKTCIGFTRHQGFLSTRATKCLTLFLNIISQLCNGLFYDIFLSYWKFYRKKKMSETFAWFLFINFRKFILNRVCNKKKHQLHTAVSVTGILNKKFYVYIKNSFIILNVLFSPNHDSSFQQNDCSGPKVSPRWRNPCSVLAL